MDSSPAKPLCYDCKYRGSIPGDCHSSCNHPEVAESIGDPLGKLISLLASANRLGPTPQTNTQTLKVVGDQHGIKNGWFAHPYNFDPVWLKSCTGFTPK